MRVMIIGGGNPLAGHIANHLCREGLAVVLMDELQTVSLIGGRGIHRIPMSAEDRRCRSVTASQRPDCVVYCAWNPDAEPAERVDPTGIGALNQALESAAASGCRKFILLASVLAHAAKEPLSVTAESLCLQYDGRAGMSVSVLSLPAVLLPESGWAEPRSQLHRVLDAKLEEWFGGSEALPNDAVTSDDGQTVPGPGPSAVVNRLYELNWIYVSDACEAVWRCMQKAGGQIIRLNNLTRMHAGALDAMLIRLLQLAAADGRPDSDDPGEDEDPEGRTAEQMLEQIRAIYPETAGSLFADGFELKLRFTLPEALSLLISERLSMQPETRVDSAGSRTLFRRATAALATVHGDDRYRQPLELAALFALFLTLRALTWNWVGRSGFDVMMVFVITSTAVLGTSSGFASVVLSALVRLLQDLHDGLTLTASLADGMNLASLLGCGLAALLVDVAVETRKHRILELESERDALSERLRFAHQMYEDARHVKDTLQDQIIGSQETLGTIYGLTRELDGTDSELVLQQAIGVLPPILKVERLAISLYNEETGTLRLLYHTACAGFQPGRSLYVGGRMVKKSMLDGTQYVDRDLRRSWPSILQPIRVNGSTRAAILLYDVPFEQASLYQLNVLRLCATMVADAWERALRLEAALTGERYWQDSGWMMPEAFEQLMRARLDAARKGIAIYSLIGFRMPEEMDPKTEPKTEDATARARAFIDRNGRTLLGLLRSEDRAGIDHLGRPAVILANASPGDAVKTLRRLRLAGFEPIPDGASAQKPEGSIPSNLKPSPALTIAPSTGGHAAAAMCDPAERRVRT